MARQALLLLLSTLLLEAGACPEVVSYAVPVAGLSMNDGQPGNCVREMTGTPPELSGLEKRKLNKQTCGQNMQAVNQAYKECAERARAGAAAAKSGERKDVLKAVFKADNQQIMSQVAQHLTEIAEECSKNGEGITPVKCGCINDKGGTIAGLTFVYPNKKGDNEIQLCKPAFTQQGRGCNGQDLADVLLHEMSHSWGRTKDNGYQMENIDKIDTRKSLDNADSYTRYAKAVFLKCKVQDMYRNGHGPAPGNRPGPQVPGGKRPGTGFGGDNGMGQPGQPGQPDGPFQPPQGPPQGPPQPPFPGSEGGNPFPPQPPFPGSEGGHQFPPQWPPFPGQNGGFDRPPFLPPNFPGPNGGFGGGFGRPPRPGFGGGGFPGSGAPPPPPDFGAGGFPGSFPGGAPPPPFPPPVTGNELGDGTGAPGFDFGDLVPGLVASAQASNPAPAPAPGFGGGLRHLSVDTGAFAAEAPSSEEGVTIYADGAEEKEGVQIFAAEAEEEGVQIFADPQ
ncbi:Metallopeptidase, catalytic domain protein [Moelleriella libera RCEF 2490]|uniref:Metallopeptidase, catalytic domain protein n=1 Tax=Moelleriella libera RCEF 2490 TaxID=1081109 RepID=A0A168CEB9_9HYPO|nr:Metallopeptidase, catalytic domain protein [Moelleriella libera RCEF 2490]